MSAAAPTYGKAMEKFLNVQVPDTGPTTRPIAPADSPIPSVPPWSSARASRERSDASDGCDRPDPTARGAVATTRPIVDAAKGSMASASAWSTSPATSSFFSP